MAVKKERRDVEQICLHDVTYERVDFEVRYMFFQNIMVFLSRSPSLLAIYNM